MATSTILYQKFLYALRWNALESIIYQAIFLVHNLALFRVTQASMYGLIGTLFSLTYLVIALANLGLDSSLTPFFSDYTRSQHSFKKLLLPQLITYAVTLLVIGLTLGFFATYWQMPIHLDQAPPSIFWVLALLLPTEGVKKSLRALLHLSFNNRITAFVELATVIFYTACVWAWYLLGYPITLSIIFVPLLIASLVGLLVLCNATYALYQQLPTHLPDQHPTVARITVNRSFSYITLMSHQIFSNNFLVPFLAATIGFHEAGIFKFIGTLYHTLSMLLHKLFSSSAEAVWSQATFLNKEEQQKLFGILSSRLYELLFVCSLFCIVNTQTFLIQRGTYTTNLWLLAVLYGMLQLSEHLFTMHEKFLIAHEKAVHLCFGTLILLGVSLYVLQHGASIGTLFTLLILRVTSFVILSGITFYVWRIKPSWRLSATSFAYVVVAALITFLIAY